MHDDESQPTPPAPLAPPAPTGAPLPPVEPPKTGPSDNAIAVAGLVVAVLALVLSMIVIGGVIAFVSLTLCIIGLRRSKTLQRGRGISIAGILLSILAIMASAAALAIFYAAVTGGEEVVRDGIITTSSNTDFPPQDDLVDVVCSASNTGDVPLAIIELENKSDGRSVYSVTVEWDTNSGVVSGEVDSDFVDAGETVSLRLFERSTSGIAETCRVTRIERSGFQLFG